MLLLARRAVLFFISFYSVSQAQIAVRTDRELMITALGVVNDPVRTVGCGAWTFCRLMTNMAGGTDPSVFTLNWLNTWKVDRVVNGKVVPKRPLVQQRILDDWPKLAGGKLNLSKAPFRLLAIVNRLDLRNAAQGHAGEGRFVFGLVSPSGAPLSMTVIFEFKLLTAIQSQEAWAKDWHSLGHPAMTMGTTYNSALQRVTDKFTRAKVGGRPNGSAIGQVRTNEIELGSPWELREFILAGSPARLVHTTVKMTPLATFNNTPALARYINANETAILAGRHRIAAPLKLAGSAPVEEVWDAPGIRNPEARHKFALNTCNGCHQAETSTGFLHISNRSKTGAAQLSDFFRNVTVFDGAGQARVFNELARRRLNFAAFLTMLDEAAAGEAGSQVIMPETGLPAAEQLERTDSPPDLIH